MFSEALWALLLLSSSFDKWLCCRAEREEGRRKITYKKRRMGCADSHIHLEGIRKRVLKSRTPSKKGRSARRAGNPGPERPKNPGPAPLPTPTPTPTPTLTPSVLLGGGGRGGWKKRITKQSIPRPVCPALATSLDLRIKLSLQTRVERDLFPAGSRAQDAGLGISQSTEQSRGKLSRAHPLSLRLRGRRDKNSSAAFRRCQ
uniref:Uncharacterized protein LOC110221486 isoform X4 n=1 Tax=Phascolarctos cinereus TaxID=38626 RepID=A0A6P5M009_PHACI|nr:uncharacterized protein LOC110221486 isoform X4 [Phascolarctos cinereus]